MVSLSAFQQKMRKVESVKIDCDFQKNVAFFYDLPILIAAAACGRDGG
jgi:hypothetical protein